MNLGKSLKSVWRICRISLTDSDLRQLPMFPDSNGAVSRLTRMNHLTKRLNSVRQLDPMFPDSNGAVSIMTRIKLLTKRLKSLMKW